MSVTVRLLVVSVALVSTACAATSRPDTHPAVAITETRSVASLHGKALDLHLAKPATTSSGAPLVVYVSGDGGWFGSAIDMWRQMARDGFATVGFSARAFLKIERPRGSVMNPAQIAMEYRSLIDQARVLLTMPQDTPVILTGWSRGAAFAVLVSSEPALRDEVLGVVAIGLAEDEDLLVNGPEDETDDGRADVGKRKGPFDNYTHIRRLTQPCAVIQATHDNYFPAAAARDRFGPDTTNHRFYAIDAANHRFSGGTDAFHRALDDALRWISSPRLPGPTAR